MLARAVASGIRRLCVPGYDLPSSRAAIDLAEAHPDMVDAAVGVHPHFADTATASDWRELARLAAHPQVVAVGEIGLDFRNLSAREEQLSAFERQLDLAGGVGKPVLVHDREAHEIVSRMLLGWGGPTGRPLHGVLHCFSGDAGMALKLAAAGFLISFALPVSFSSAIGPRAAAAALPEGSYLVETDSPWLAPGGAEQRNEPTTVLRVAGTVARLRGATPEAIAAGSSSAYTRLVEA